MNLYPFQERVLENTKDKNKVAYYLDMGLGKTYVGAEKMNQLREKTNLVICQKSKIDDWVEHFKNNYLFKVFDLTNKEQLNEYMGKAASERFTIVGIINYELAFRRTDLTTLYNFTLLLDESSLIQNENAKRSKFILNKLHPKNVILLSGTPTGGKYENLWSQMHLLGWKISKELYWNHYVEVEYLDNEGFPIKVVRGYKNVDRLKEKMREYGCQFLKTDEVFDLPEQTFITQNVETSKEYKKFRKSGIVEIKERVEIKTTEGGPTIERDAYTELVGETTLTKMLYERQLCGHFNEEKLKATQDLLESTDDRVIIFYNFNQELYAIEDICRALDKPMSIVNGHEKDLRCYEEYDNSVTCIQYQAGAMGLNLQKANTIIYFTPPLSSELFEQSKKRIHRIGQEQACFYYQLTCKNSVEEKIYKALEMRKDYTEELFKEELR